MAKIDKIIWDRINARVCPITGRPFKNDRDEFDKDTPIHLTYEAVLFHFNKVQIATWVNRKYIHYENN
jgi:hypothetical protein